MMKGKYRLAQSDFREPGVLKTGVVNQGKVITPESPAERQRVSLAGPVAR